MGVFTMCDCSEKKLKREKYFLLESISDLNATDTPATWFFLEKNYLKETRDILPILEGEGLIEINKPDPTLPKKKQLWTWTVTKKGNQLLDRPRNSEYYNKYGWRKGIHY